MTKMEKNIKKEMVTITQSEYERLIRNDRWLQCLNAAGVDNWGGIEEAYIIKKEWEEELDNERK